MSRLPICTLTGVDEKTDRGHLRELMCEFPIAEFGVLWSDTRAGHGCYPSKRFIDNFTWRFRADPIALHVCGGAVERLARGDEDIVTIARRCPRVQINAILDAVALWKDRVEAILDLLPRQEVILQHNASNQAFIAGFPERLRLAALFDRSGGRGLLPEAWPTSFQNRACGYAGGLGPDNLERELPRIAAAADPRQFWIDMESSLRTNDVFDLDKCRKALEIASKWAGENP